MLLPYDITSLLDARFSEGQPNPRARYRFEAISIPKPCDCPVLPSVMIAIDSQSSACADTSSKPLLVTSKARLLMYSFLPILRCSVSVTLPLVE